MKLHHADIMNARTWRAILLTLFCLISGCTINSIEPEARALAEAGRNSALAMEVMGDLIQKADVTKFHATWKPKAVQGTAKIEPANRNCSLRSEGFDPKGCPLKATDLSGQSSSPLLADNFDRAFQTTNVSLAIAIQRDLYHAIANLAGAGSLSQINGDLADTAFALKAASEARARSASQVVSAIKDQLKDAEKVPEGDRSQEDKEAIKELQKDLAEAEDKKLKTENQAAVNYTRIDAVDSIFGEFFAYKIAEARLDAVEQAVWSARFKRDDDDNFDTIAFSDDLCRASEESRIYVANSDVGLAFMGYMRRLVSVWSGVHRADAQRLEDFAEKAANFEVPESWSNLSRADAYDRLYSAFSFSREITLGLDQIMANGKFMCRVDASGQEKCQTGPLQVELLWSFDGALGSLYCIAHDISKREEYAQSIYSIKSLSSLVTDALIRINEAVEQRLALGELAHADPRD